MSSHIYRRDAVYWWRRGISLAVPGAGPTILVRLSLKTPVLAQARMRGGWLDMQTGTIAAEVQTRAAGLTPEDLRSVFRIAFRTALDRYLMQQQQVPWLEQESIRSDIAHARYFRLTAALPYEPVPGFELDHALGADLSLEERAEVQKVAGYYERGSAIGHNYVARYLREAGCSDSPGNVERARRIVAVAYAEACIAAAKAAGGPDSRDRLPPLPATLLTILGMKPLDLASNFLEAQQAELEVGSALQCQPAPADPTPQLPAPTVGTSSGSASHAIDCPISQLAQAAADVSIASGKWSKTCRGDVRGAVNLFIAANGDLLLSQIHQVHVAQMNALISELPRVYGKLKEGGTKDAPVYETIEEAAERGKELRRKWEEDPQQAARNGVLKPGLSIATRNKHLQWLNQIFAFGNVSGYVPVQVEVKGLKLRDKRKQNSKRRSWDIKDLAVLLSGPVWEGCAGINHRMVPGDIIIHDGMYFGPPLLVAHGCRSDEVTGLMLDDVFDSSPIPYIWYRDNAYRKLKTGNSERSLPIPKGLIALGFIDYCRELRAAGQQLVFPELWNPKMDFDKVFRDKVFYPLRDFHFPEGTSRNRAGKDVDVHSWRATAISVLDQTDFKESHIVRFFGHCADSETFGTYADDLRHSIFVPFVETLWKLVPPIQPAPLRLRPEDRLVFGSPRGRRKKLPG